MSIVTPIYNSEKFLDATIQSVISQTHQNWELLLVFDQATNDGSMKIAEHYRQQDSRLKILKFENKQRVSGARNFGIDNASGNWIAFLDSDDLWLPEKLEKQLRFAAQKRLLFLCSGYIRIDESGKTISRPTFPPHVANYDRLLSNNTIACLTAMIHKQALGGIRFMDHHQEDFIFWLQILKQGLPCHGQQEVLAKYRIVPTSRSTTVFRPKTRWTVYRRIENLSVVKSLFLLFMYGATAIFKRL